MRSFSNFGEFANYLLAISQSLHIAQEVALNNAAAIIQEEAKAEIGHYQESAGPFIPWQQLKDDTIKRREQLGYTPDDPLYRDGTLRDNIMRSSSPIEAAVGVPHGEISTSGGGKEPVDIGDIAIWQELGTHPMHNNPIPPRSFLGGAAVRKGEEAAMVAGKEIAKFLSGEPVILRND